MTAPAARARFKFLVELYLGSVLGWVDITADVRGSITIGRGRTSEGNRADPGSCTLRLDNISGDYSPRNPAGQWYGYIGRNTPIRVSAGLVGGSMVGRFYGEIADWPPSWNLSGTVREIDVEAAGILRRVQQGGQPVYSPLRRTVAGSGVLAYWPMEDGSDTGQGGSAIAGVPALSISGTVPFADIASWTSSQGYTVDYGTEALADLASGGTLSAAVPASVTAATAAGWTVGVCSDVTVGVALSADLVLVEVDTPGGTYVRWQLVIVAATGRTQVIAYDLSGTPTTVVDYPTVKTSMIPHDFAVWQNGGNISAGYLYDGSSYFATGSIAGTLAGITAVHVNPTGTTATVPVPTGHLAVWAGHDLPATAYYDGDVMLALFAWLWTGIGTVDAAPTGEAADVRLARLWTDRGVTVAVPTAEDSPIMLGGQPSSTLTDLTDQSVDADGGMLHESRDALGLAYRTRASLYNQIPIPIAYTQLAPPFAPDPSADDVRNDVTVKRTDGSSARAVQTSGRLAAVPPPEGVGVYQTSVEVNTVDDARLADLAEWRVHVGTVDADRYPALSVQLAGPQWQGAPSGVVDVLAVDTGDVLDVTGLPSWATGDARTMVTGYTETIDEWLWLITFAGVPAQPWTVAEVDGDARVASDGSTLAAELTATAPATLNSNPYFEADASGWYNNTGEGSIARSTAQAHEGTASLLVTPDGVSSGAYARSVAATGVAPGQVLFAAAWVRCAVTRSVRLRIDWRDGAGAFLSSTSTDIAVSAGVWTYVWLLGTAPASTAQAGVTARMTGTPPITDLLHVDEALLRTTVTMSLASTAANGVWTTDVADFPLDVNVGGERITLSAIAGATSPQTPTISDRTIAMTHPAGTTVDVWQPAVVPL